MKNIRNKKLNDSRTLDNFNFKYSYFLRLVIGFRSVAFANFHFLFFSSFLIIFYLHLVQVEDLRESELELKLILEMYRRESIDSRLGSHIWN